jgi:hypothetical protein
VIDAITTTCAGCRARLDILRFVVFAGDQGASVITYPLYGSDEEPGLLVWDCPVCGHGDTLDEEVSA